MTTKKRLAFEIIGSILILYIMYGCSSINTQRPIIGEEVIGPFGFYEMCDDEKTQIKEVCQ